MEPFEGKVEIDGKNLQEVFIRTIRRKISVIAQDSYLFEGTLKKNLDPIGTKSDEELWEVLKLSGLAEKFEENGLNSTITQNGDNFSAGERQLISISRALLKVYFFNIKTEIKNRSHR